MYLVALVRRQRDTRRHHSRPRGDAPRRHPRGYAVQWWYGLSPGPHRVHERLFTTQNIVNLARHKDEPHVFIEDGEPYWLTPAPGEVSITDAKGHTRKAHAEDVPASITLDGSWKVHFSQKWGKEWDTELPRLISLSESEDDDIRYFSGTAVYTTTFMLPKDYLKEDLLLEARLGQVYVIAELFVNGKDMGILWNEPYSQDITKALHEGKNTIEVRVTNQHGSTGKKTMTCNPPA